MKIGLVLEGGGLRGLYTAGVLDMFLDETISFPYCIGVSAGACNMVSYLSKQRGRNFHVNTDFVEDKNYLSWRNFIKTGSVFGMEMLFNTIPNSLVPFDYTAYAQYKGTAVVGTTDCKTGEAIYIESPDFRLPGGFLALQASSSLPLLAQMVEYEDYVLLDGGIADPIPVRKALKDGCEKLVIILTREESYRKKKNKTSLLMYLKYHRKYPGICTAMKHRHIVYNDTLQMINELEKSGKALVIRPQKPVMVDRLERNRKRLTALYNQGFEDAMSKKDVLQNFLRSDNETDA